ncbi:Alpha/Beta hydrolase protein [Penicillium cataractarum]|uniref:Alpha/Beta hydrolase protein n=1 Tax=Penicillium cataractarum TaxID=2100454 RepID=A0A9W9UUD9_9EURO|nr:Alpha/Beta hydrolase protein [Penicillium cataractarum]KAJ5355106.1 Alpha/Beta hydrolase protein [Penicillium cataractarum]
MKTRMRMISNTKGDTLREHRIPVLGRPGTDDEIIKPSQEESFRAVLPDADFQFIPNGGHDLQNTSPNEFVQHVQSFMEKKVASGQRIANT